jgi:hypothetical protein
MKNSDIKGHYCTERAPVKPPIVTATDLLRAALKSKNLAAMAKELQVATETLNSFVAGRTDLPSTLKQQLTSEIFGGTAIYNAELDRLQSSNQAKPTPMSALPPRYVPPKVNYQAGVMTQRGPQPVKPEKPKAERYRPGWAR